MLHIRHLSWQNVKKRVYGHYLGWVTHIAAMNSNRIPKLTYRIVRYPMRARATNTRTAMIIPVRDMRLLDDCSSTRYLSSVTHRAKTGEEEMTSGGSAKVEEGYRH